MNKMIRRNRFGDSYDDRGTPRYPEKRPGDWVCDVCKYQNFSYRSDCRQCGNRPVKRDVAEGDWLCPKCDFYNFQSRSNCFKCSTPAPSSLSSSEN
ncbi:12812_t:CDS:2 [Entrophospora sp. SA101]|nr:2946_t:CDS:2 [Entrophospora candida]CAH1762768.1 13869_t:CDS:2 [Entrophospora sp. SA101]CAJ0636626.1 12552_t:CDS:2 [Entrophospora sp. SA101]CAJ0748066.1 14007_t:CDS:2 [Entrophospora sp. SA101]CAJ0756789.1 12812_t:CDS:2 [Entrophospora sp. SA101]